MSKVALSVVHHANQLVITNGYDNRDGISRIASGYLEVLELHRRYGIPTSLHLSGTLVEAMLWHEPARLNRIRTLLAEGSCTLLGGTYSEPIMPMLSDAMNRLQLTTMRETIAAQFPAVADRVRTAWVPERVWDPRLAQVLTDPGLPQGPYRRTLVDDRLMVARERVDGDGPFHWRPREHPPAYRPELIDPDMLRPRTAVVGDRRLTMVPICSYLRYLFPPRTDDQREFLRSLFADLAARNTADDPMLLVYADDMERAAGVGGWEPAIGDYERLLAWLADNDDVQLVELDGWLDRHDAADRDPVPAGSYFELEVGWQAGASYAGWADSPQWTPYERLLRTVETELARARSRHARHRGASELLALAERLLMLGQHETAWRDPVEGCVDGSVRHLAPWVRATAAHARLALPLIAAADWTQRPSPVPVAELDDIDGDGEPELLLANDQVWCLVSPGDGARLTMMCHRNGRHCSLVVGNPADHWNFQEELHRFMEVPAGHPGALTDHGSPHEEFVAEPGPSRDDVAIVHLRRRGEAAWCRRYAVVAGVPGLLVTIRDGKPGDVVDSLLTPDYLTALTRGERAVPQRGERYVCWSDGTRGSWVGFDPGQARALASGPAAAGHGHLVNLCLLGGQADLIVGAGRVSDRQVAGWLARGRAAVAPELPADAPVEVVPAGVLARAAR